MGTAPKKFLVIGIDQAIPCFIEKFYEENLIPNIGSLIEKGVMTEAYPCPPCDTPTNWATIATGATTATHGVTSFYLHLPGEPLDHGLRYRSRTQLYRYCQAEYYWDVAERNGLTPFVFNYPSGWPSTFKKGAMSLFTWPIPESLPIMLMSSKRYLFNNISKDPSTKLIPVEKIDIKSGNFPTLRATLNIRSRELEDQPLITIYLIASKGKGYDAIKIPINGNKYDIIKDDEWSNWISASLNTIHGVLPCLFKLKIKNLDSDGNSLEIQVSEVYNTLGWSFPQDFGEKLIKNVFKNSLPKKGKVEFMMYGKINRFLSSARRESLTIADSIKFSQHELKWDICFFHYHPLDTINHDLLAYLERDFPLYSEKKEKKALNNIEIAYKIVDKLVENLLNSCVDENTVVVFISDHGAIPIWKMVNIPMIFKEEGLTSYKIDKNHKYYKIDWKNTIAFPYLEPPFVWINLRGRDPHGTVKRSEYEDVRNRVIEALLNLKDPETNNHVIEKVLKREETAHLGLNGKRIGDLIYFLNPPYGLFDGILSHLNASTLTRDQISKPIITNSRKFFGAHAYYLPSTKFGSCSISAPLIMSGPGIKKGVISKTSVNLVDVIPTLAYLLQTPKPINSQGRVLEEFLI